jgi:hypothetical protein
MANNPLAGSERQPMQGQEFDKQRHCRLIRTDPERNSGGDSFFCGTHVHRRERSRTRIRSPVLPNFQGRP